MADMPRYQNGSLELANTSAGPTWYIRFTHPDGSRPRLRVGTVAEFPSKPKATRAAQPLRDQFNAGEHAPKPVYTVDMLVRRYELEEMPQRFSTATGYRKLHNNFILPRWGKAVLDDVAPLEVRAWLRALTLKNGELASSRTRGHVHNQFKNLLKHAMLWKWMTPQVNPLSLFSLEGATKRTKLPRVISPDDFRALFSYFAADARLQLMITAAYLLGLRISELSALKWSDIDYLSRTVTIERAVVRNHVDRVKTERSEAPLPLAPQLTKAFQRWHAECHYPAPSDWIFASDRHVGRLPVDARFLQTDRLRPAGTSIGLNFSLGWHTFRHSYKSLLDRVSADATVKRDLMRHADVHTTMQVYGEVEMDRLRAINEAAIALAMPEAVN